MPSMTIWSMDQKRSVLLASLVALPDILEHKDADPRLFVVTCVTPRAMPVPIASTAQPAPTTFALAETVTAHCIVSDPRTIKTPRMDLLLVRWRKRTTQQRLLAAATPSLVSIIEPWCWAVRIDAQVGSPSQPGNHADNISRQTRDVVATLAPRQHKGVQRLATNVPERFWQIRTFKMGALTTALAQKRGISQRRIN